MKNINLLVIGCGRIGKMHIDNIIKFNPEINIKGIVDNNLSPDWADDRNISLHSQNELPILLNDTDINCVLIAAPSSEHVKLITAAAEAGKHVFCEKPVSFKPEELDKVINLTKKQQVRFQVGYNRRFDPDFLKVKEAIDTDVIGNIHIIKITNRDPKRPNPDFIPQSGGLFLDFNVHDFDLARFISGAEIEEVFAMGANLVDPKIGELGDIDTAIISLKMSNGALCIIDASRETHYGYDQRLEVFGSKGNILANNTRLTNTLLSTEKTVETEKPYYSFVERYVEAYRNELNEFFNSIKTNQATRVSGNDAKQAVIAAKAALESYRSNLPVRLITEKSYDQDLTTAPA